MLRNDKKLNQHLDIEVELMSHDHEMMGLNPAGQQAFFSPTSKRLSLSNASLCRSLKEVQRNCFSPQNATCGLGVTMSSGRLSGVFQMTMGAKLAAPKNAFNVSETGID